MKVVIALAACCLLAALGFALWPVAAEVQLVHEVLPAEPIPPALREPESNRARPEVVVAQLSLEEAPEGVVVGDLIEPEDPDLVVLKGRVNVLSGVQPDVHLVLSSQCTPMQECDPSTYETDADPQTGEFELGVYPGTFRLVARGEGYLPAAEEGIVLTAGEQLGDLVMLLEPGDRITGTVTAEGVVADSVRVTAEGQGFVRHTFTDPLGRYELTGLPRGSYTVRAYAELSGGDQKTAQSGSSVDLALGHREKLFGRVLDERGFPAEGAVIFTDFNALIVEDKDPYPVAADMGSIGLGMHGCGPSPGCYQRAVTGPDGRFELEGTQGETLIVAARLGDRLAVLDGVVPGDAIELQLKAGPRVRLVRIWGGSVANTELEVYPQTSFLRQQLTTDADGWVTLPADGRVELSLPSETRLEGDVPGRVHVIEMQPLDLKHPVEDVIY